MIVQPVFLIGMLFLPILWHYDKSSIGIDVHVLNISAKFEIGRKISHSMS